MPTDQATRTRLEAIRRQATNAGTDEAHQLVERLRGEATDIAIEHSAVDFGVAADTEYALNTMLDATIDKLRTIRARRS